MDVIKMAPLVLVVSALSLSIVEGNVNPQDVYSNSYEYKLMEDFSWERGGLNRLLEQSKQAEGAAQRRTTERAAVSSCPIDGITDEGTCYALASITPLLGVKEQCREQSLVYLTELFNVNGAKSEDGWAQKMFDSNGKRPNGLMNGFAHFCWAWSQLSQDPCPSVFNAWNPPNGYVHSEGRINQCLHIKGPDFKGRYLYAKLVYDDTDVNSGLLPNTTIPRGGGYWVQDIVENLPEYPPFLDDFEDFQSSMWLTRLSQKVGMCVPSGCSGLDVFENYRQLYEHINAKLEKTSYTELSLTEDYFYEGYLEGTILDGYENILPASWTWGQWLYVVTMSIIAFLMVISLSMELFYYIQQKSVSVFGFLLFQKSSGPKPILVKAVLCFSPYINLKKILKTVDANAVGQIGCLTGMRVISMSWVILAHVFGFLPGQWAQNELYSWNAQLGNTATYQLEVITNGYYSVDTFFFMSGLLVGYLTFLELEKKRFNIVMFYILRYIRLTIPLALVIGFNITISPYIATEAWFTTSSKFVGLGCSEEWWHIILYIANLTRKPNCLGQTWYLWADMQMFVMSPIVILPMFYWQKNNAGLKLWLLVLAFFSFVPLSITLINGLGPYGIFTTLEAGFDPFLDYYIQPYIRALPYIWGILVGYIMFKLRGKKLEISWITNLFMWTIAFIAAWEAVFGISYLRRGNKLNFPKWSPFDAGCYEMLAKSAWSVGIGWVTLSCAKGSGGPLGLGLVNKFLSWGVFQPLAKISYMMYLLHLTVIYQLFLNTRTYSMEYNNAGQFIHFIGLVAVSFACSLVFCLAFEAPFMHLQKLVLGVLMGGNSAGKRSQPVKAKPAAQTNGSNGQTKATAVEISSNDHTNK